MNRNNKNHNILNNQYTEHENSTFMRLYSHYTLLALNRYRWINLPDGVESRHIERFLYERGQAFFYNDPELGIIALPCSSGGPLNIYGEPLMLILTSLNGFTKHIKIDEGVRIMNNDLCYPDSFKIRQYVKKMVDSEIVIESNIKQQKFPFIIPATKDSLYTMKNIFTKFFNDNEPVIFMDKSLTNGEGEGIKVLKTEAPFVADKILKYNKDLERELLTILGINNMMEKPERMVVDEVNINNGEIEMNLDLGFKSRQHACELINEKYNLDISVEKVLQKITPTFDTTISSKKFEEGGNING